ncbi:uncharacterized protein Triagg1_9367 [Trichoderma aggressivum f. europaeum]|uniref:Uncharacterized protein n=1 Tax=Trichoderma aggressivum f. europaeum TaxID=173218 RepID=A0AAE1I8N8_9HYPO|nr:hypothetical protein Triagg1_9367 [Trichoderma aggressivum f. europaeum]
MAISSVCDLPAEMILLFMERLPNVPTLTNFILCNRSIYNIYINHPTHILLSVLENELGKDLLVHAIVAHQVEKMDVTLPRFASLSMDQIDSEVANLRGIRDQAFILQHSSPRLSSIKITLRDASRISSLWTKVSQLSEAFVGDCTSGLGRVFYPLEDSIRWRPVSVSEMRRLRQSMYMFHILSLFCEDLFLDVQLDQHNQVIQQKVIACMDKISKLQRTLVDGFMAPWELYQVVSLQAWFRRQLRELERDTYLNERLMPYLLSRGIECMHEGMCLDRHARFGYASEREGGFYFFLNTMKEKARCHPAHGFGMVLSRGIRDNWARKTPRAFDRYNCFGGRPDKEAYTIWRNFGISRHTLGFDLSAPGSFDVLAETEGILDVWSAAIWDPIRWSDIRRTMDGNMQPYPWYFVTLPWDPFLVGWQSAMDPRMRDGVRRERRSRPFAAWFRMMAASLLEYTVSLVTTPVAILVVLLRR